MSAAYLSESASPHTGLRFVSGAQRGGLEFSSSGLSPAGNHRGVASKNAHARSGIYKKNALPSSDEHVQKGKKHLMPTYCALSAEAKREEGRFGRVHVVPDAQRMEKAYYENGRVPLYPVTEPPPREVKPKATGTAGYNRSHETTSYFNSENHDDHFKHFGNYPLSHNRRAMTHEPGTDTSLQLTSYYYTPMSGKNGGCGSGATRTSNSTKTFTSVQLAKSRLERTARNKNDQFNEFAKEAVQEANATNNNEILVERDLQLQRRTAARNYAEERQRKLGEERAALLKQGKTEAAAELDNSNAFRGMYDAEGFPKRDQTLGRLNPALYNSTPFALYDSKPRDPVVTSIRTSNYKNHESKIEEPVPRKVKMHAHLSKEAPYDNVVVSGDNYPPPPPVGEKVLPRTGKTRVDQHLSKDDMDTDLARRAKARCTHSANERMPDFLFGGAHGSNSAWGTAPETGAATYRPSLRNRTEARWKAEDDVRATHFHTGKAMAGPRHKSTALW